MPVLVWGETGCTYNSLVMQTFLNEVASHGIFIVAAGTPNGANNPNGVRDTENPNGTVLVQAVDWVTSAAAKAKYPKVDSSRIGIAGHSCGATQSYMLWNDPRITTLGIFNSGLFPPNGTASHPIPAQLKKPIFYFLGGPTDIAYKNVSRHSRRV
jgi:dienelactone hydrolase